MTEADLKSLPELFSAATDWSKADGMGDWSAVTALHELGTRDVLDRTLELSKSADLRARARAATILGRLGLPDRTFPEECVDATLELLIRDPEPDVRAAASDALWELEHPRGTKGLAALIDHPDEVLRFHVARALSGNPAPEAIAALIHLTKDPDPDVRDWATFGLGEQGIIDTHEVREALFQRMSDGDDDTQFEAVCGLARCGDHRCVPSLIKRLTESPDEFWLLVAARRILGLNEDSEQSSDELLARLHSLD